MIYWQLFRVFFVIGLFCFGGGYAILPFIQDTVVSNGWITMHEFADIIAVAESTPGPVSINTATYVGFKMGGFLGAAIATSALCLPAFIMVLTVVKVLSTPKGGAFLDRILVGIKPVVVGMILYAAWQIAYTVLFSAPLHATIDGINWLALSLGAAAFVAVHFFKVNALHIILVSAVVGVALAFL